MSDDLAPIRRAFTIDDLRAALPVQVRQTILVQAAASLDETRELLRAASGCEPIAGVVGWIDLTADGVADCIRELQNCEGGAYLVAIRHQVHDEQDPGWLMRADVLRGLHAVADAGLAFDLLIRPRESPAALQAARRLPGLQFVVDHGGKPDVAGAAWEPWNSHLQQLAALGNAACKLSGLITQASWNAWTPEQIIPYAHRILELFGPARVLFGSDWPVCLLAASYDRVVDLAQRCVAHLAPPERSAIFAGNARRIYRLPQPE